MSTPGDMIGAENIYLLPAGPPEAQEQAGEPTVDSMSDEFIRQNAGQGYDVLSLREAIDSLVNEQITLKRIWTVEGLAVRAVSLFARPFRGIITRREETVLKTRAAIVAESVRTGLTPGKGIKGRDKLRAAALGAVEEANAETPDGQVDTSELYKDILSQYGITPAEAMKLTEGKFAGSEKQTKKLLSVAAVVAMLVMGHQVSKLDSPDKSQMASSVRPAAQPQTTTTKVPETTTTTVAPPVPAPAPAPAPEPAPAPAAEVAPPPAPAPAEVAPPAPVVEPAPAPPPPTAPPIVYSDEQIKLGTYLRFSVNGEPLEQVVEYLRKETGEQWDVATLRSYTNIVPGFRGITAVNNCRDNAVLIRYGEGLMKIATDNNTTMQQIKELMPDGEPRMKAGLCLPIPPK